MPSLRLVECSAAMPETPSSSPASLDQFLRDCRDQNVTLIRLGVKSYGIDEVRSRRFNYIHIASVFAEYSALCGGNALPHRTEFEVGALCYDKRIVHYREALTRPKGILEGMAQPLEEIEQGAEQTALYMIQQGMPLVEVRFSLLHPMPDSTYLKSSFSEGIDSAMLPPRWGNIIKPNTAFPQDEHPLPERFGSRIEQIT